MKTAASKSIAAQITAGHSRAGLCHSPGKSTAAVSSAHLRIGVVQIAFQFREVVITHGLSLCEQQLEIHPIQPSHLRRFSSGKRPSQVKRKREFLPKLVRDPTSDQFFEIANSFLAPRLA